MNTPDQNLDPGARAIINTNYDTNNIVPIDESTPRIKKTLKSCQTILKRHCGPQSGYAMLVNNMSAGMNFEPSIFTRDGIRILSSVEFLSPLERYVKEMLTYVGKRVDDAAKDGTTTSMLFSALFLDKVLDHLKDVQNSGLSFFQMNKVIEATFADILHNLEFYTFSIERMNNSDEEVSEEVKVATAGIVAYMQALSSSGGNVELAVAMKEIFEKSPSISWDFITSHNSIKETGKAFEVEVSPYDAHIRVITALEGQLNKTLNTEYDENDAELLIFSNPILNGSVVLDALFTHLNKSDTNTPINIISKNFPADLINEVFRLNNLRTGKIALWQYSPETRFAGMNYPYELLILAAIAGVKPFDMENGVDYIDPEKHVVKVNRIYYHDGYLDFYGLVPSTEETLHPFYLHPDTAPQFYNDVRKQLENELTLYREGHKKDGRMFGLFMEMMNRIACLHRPTLRLGGPAHEQVANNDVVQDVQGAIMSSLKHGFLINGPISIYQAIDEAIKPCDPDASSELKAANDFATLILNCMKESISEIISVVHADDPVDLKTFAREPSKYVNSLNDNEVLEFDDFVAEVKEGKHYDNQSEDGMRLGSTYPVLQPVAITKELLKRMQELLMKFVNTNEIVVYGGVVVNDKESK